jgi:hypothetical protein
MQWKGCEKMYEFNYKGMDGCKWGVSDWYENFEDEMVRAIESNEPFDTGWVGCKKEIESFRVTRNEDGDAYVEVWEGMDEGQDLVYDAIWSVFGSEYDSDVSEEDMDEILEMLWSECDFCTEREFGCELDFNESSSTEEKIQRLKKALDEQISLTDKDLEWSYSICKETVKEFFTEKYGWKVKEK